MYRLMVVEDEEMIRRGIVRSVDWSSLGFQVVGEAKNGSEAIEVLKDTAVDVLLTDIKMPIMDGIELSKKARKMFPLIEIVILSGFSDFEYARQAISFRAFDYILKPTNKKKLMDVFSRLKDSMDQKKEEKEEAFHKNILMTAGYENLRHDFLTGLMSGNDNILKDFDERTGNLELDFSGNFYSAGIIKFNKKNIREELERAWVTDQRLLKFAYSNIIDEILSNEDHIYYYVESNETIVFIFCFDHREDEEKRLVPCLEEVCESIQNCLFKAGPVPYVVGVGLSYPDIRYIGKSFNQAQKSIRSNFYGDGGEIQRYRDHQESQYEQNFIQFYPEEMKPAVIAICTGQYTETRRHLKAMFENLIIRKIMPEIVKNYCVTLLLTVKSNLSDDSLIDQIISEGYMEIVKETVSVAELQNYVMETMVALAKQVTGTFDAKEETDQEEVINKAQIFIETHLTDKLTLKMISDHVYLSENYFSVLFKKITGKTYISYIQERRMEEAKRLLVETNLKVYEICEKIGYSDYKYFSGQFKKIVAMTPKEYRKQGRKVLES